MAKKNGESVINPDTDRELAPHTWEKKRGGVLDGPEPGLENGNLCAFH